MSEVSCGSPFTLCDRSDQHTEALNTHYDQYN